MMITRMATIDKVSLSFELGFLVRCPPSSDSKPGDYRALRAVGLGLSVTFRACARSRARASITSRSTGADRQTSIDFWEGVLGMPFVFEQPNLDRRRGEPPLLRSGRRPADHDLHQRGPRPTRPHARTDPGHVHHVAFAVSNATFRQTVERLDERGIEHSGVKDRGFMDSIYFRDPLGLLIELASYRFEPPAGHTHADVLLEAHMIRVERGDYNIAPVHLADAIEQLSARRESLSDG